MGIQEDIFRLERDINQLVRDYEKYFLGLEKREPFELMASVDRQIRAYSATPINNTMLKFKFNTLTAKLNTYKEHWRRTIDLIESGKYSRDRFKMELRKGKEASDRDEAGNINAAPDSAQTLYDEYIKARAACNLNLKGITKESIEQVINKQKPALLQKFGCRDILFKVVVEGDTPKIKAYPVK